jgi:hypothetical protein
MARVASGLDNRQSHSGATEPVGCMLRQSASNSAPLVIRVDGQHHDRPDQLVRIERRGYESDRDRC